MLRGLLIGAATCLTALATVGAASGAPITLKSGLLPDRQVQFDYTQNIDITQTSNAGAEPTTEKHSLETRAQFTARIVQVAPDGTGEGSLKIRSFSARQENPDGPISVTFDFTNGAPAPPAEGDGVGALGATIAGATLTFDIDATGEVVRVHGLEKILEAMQNAGQVPQTLKSFFDPAALTQMLSVLYHAEGGIGAHDLGTSWESSRRVPFGPAGALELNTTSVLQLADGGTGVIAGVTKIDLYVPREPGEGTPKVALGAADAQALTQWDLTIGGLISHVNTQNIATTWTLATLKVDQTQTSRTEIKRSGD